jgi:hypothetical protein
VLAERDLHRVEKFDDVRDQHDSIEQRDDASRKRAPYDALNEVDSLGAEQDQGAAGEAQAETHADDIFDRREGAANPGARVGPWRIGSTQAAPPESRDVPVGRHRVG